MCFSFWNTLHVIFILLNFRQIEIYYISFFTGQFGVGFYSAFVVSDKVTVITKKVGENVGFTWIWEG